MNKTEVNGTIDCCTVGRILGNIQIGGLLGRSKDLLLLCPKLIEERAEERRDKKTSKKELLSQLLKFSYGAGNGSRTHL